MRTRRTYEHRLTRAGRPVLLALATVMLVNQTAAPAQAQTKAKQPAKPKFEDLTLTTKDGVILRCTYYPGPPSKQTVPLILLHGWDGRSGQLHELALFLQKANHSVLVPDLRGHGRSVNIRGSNVPIDRAEMKPAAIASMVWDVEAAKNFLLKENNEQKVNIEQLGVLGVEFGALLAVNWAAQDWSARNLPTFKQGQDVKGLILISPLRSFKGIESAGALKNPGLQRGVSVLMLVGTQDTGIFGDARRIFKALEPFHDPAQQSLVFLEYDTSLQGMGLVEGSGFNAPAAVRHFIEQRLVKHGANFPWTDRTSPLK